MRNITVPVYKFSELSEEARDRVMRDHQAHWGYGRSVEAMASITALAEHFGAKVTDWEVCWDGSSYSSMRFDVPDDWTDDALAAAVKELGEYNPDTLKGNGDCVLTGYCLDEDAIDGLRRAYHDGVRDVAELLQAAFESWLSACQADYDDEYSYETFGEYSDANDLEYFADGRPA